MFPAECQPGIALSNRGANRAPTVNTTAATTSATSVDPSPNARFEWSLTTPMMCGEIASPSR